MILTGEPIDAREALRIGLLNRVVPAAELLPAAEALARTILTRGPVALRYALQAVHEGLQTTLNEGLSMEAALVGLCCATEDMREGTRAFAEKRKPAFTLRARSVTGFAGDRKLLQGVELLIHDDRGGNVKVSGIEGQFDVTDRRARLSGDVTVENESEGLSLRTGTLFYDNERDMIFT